MAPEGAGLLGVNVVHGSDETLEASAEEIKETAANVDLNCILFE